MLLAWLGVAVGLRQDIAKRDTPGAHTTETNSKQRVSDGDNISDSDNISIAEVPAAGGWCDGVLHIPSRVSCVKRRSSAFSASVVRVISYLQAPHATATASATGGNSNESVTTSVALPTSGSTQNKLYGQQSPHPRTHSTLRRTFVEQTHRFGDVDESQHPDLAW